jgi:hypothetical protein
LPATLLDRGADGFAYIEIIVDKKSVLCCGSSGERAGVWIGRRDSCAALALQPPTVKENQSD